MVENGPWLAKSYYEQVIMYMINIVLLASKTHNKE